MMVPRKRKDSTVSTGEGDRGWCYENQIENTEMGGAKTCLPLLWLGRDILTAEYITTAYDSQYKELDSISVCHRQKMRCHGGAKYAPENAYRRKIE